MYSNNYVDSKSTYNYNELLYYIMKSTVDKVNYLNTLSIYIYIYIIIYIYIYLYILYIDEIFSMWQHCEDKLEQFHAYVNSIHPIINLTLTLSATNICYLDVSVAFDGTNIHTSIYTKSTDRHGYLHCKSFPFSQ